MPKNLLQTDFDYPGYFDQPAQCTVRVYQIDPILAFDADKILVICTNGWGTSVTNRAEVLATKIYQELLPQLPVNVTPDDIIWIESYNREEGYKRRDEPIATFYEWVFEHNGTGIRTTPANEKVLFCGISWKPVDIEEVEEMIEDYWKNPPILKRPEDDNA